MSDSEEEKISSFKKVPNKYDDDDECFHVDEYERHNPHSYINQNF